MNTNKFLKISLFFFSLFALVCLAGAAWVTHTFAPEKIKPQLEAGFSEFLQRDLTIETVSWSFRPQPALRGTGVVLKDDQGQVMAGSPFIVLDIGFWELWKGKIRVKNLSFEKSRINIWTTPGGGNSLADIISDIKARLQKKKEDGQKPVRFAFEKITLGAASIRLYENGFDQGGGPLRLLAHGSGRFEKNSQGLFFPFEVEGVFEIKDNPSKFNASGVLSRQPKMDITLESILFQDLAKYWPPAEGIDGRVTLGLAYKGGENKDWTLRFNSGGVRLSTQSPTPTLIASGFIEKTGTSSVNVTLRGSRTRAEGTMTFQGHIPSTVTAAVSAQELDLYEFWGWLKQLHQLMDWSREKSHKKLFADLSIEGDLKNVHLRSVKMDRLKMSLNRKNQGEFRFDPITAEGLGGQAEGRFILVLPDPGEGSRANPPVFRSSFTLSQVAIGPLMDSAGLGLRIKGKSDWAWVLSGPVHPSVKTKLNGWVKASMGKGIILNAPVLLKSLSRINLTSLLEVTEGEAKKGFPIDRGEVNAVFKDGKVTFDPPARLENKTVHIGFEGVIDTNRETIRGRLVFRFLSVLNEVLSAVPGLGTVIYGNQKSLVPVYMEVSGPVQDPKLGVKPLESVAKTIQSTFKRLLGIPLEGLEKSGR